MENIPVNPNDSIRQIRFKPLQITQSTVRVEWEMTEESPIYLRTHFTLDFSEVLDPRTLPLKLWWTVAILCIHSHWNLLRPCRIVLPVTLDPDEIEFWLRLLDHERVTLELTRKGNDFARTVEITCEGPILTQDPLPEKTDRYAATYSGGKDGLLQAAVLCEFTENPLLLNVVSPMSGMSDHDCLQRDRALDEFKRRRNVEMVVVKSDLRSIWPDYEISKNLGYQKSMSMITDSYLYGASLFAVAAARGIGTIAMATEFDRYPNQTTDLSLPAIFGTSLLAISVFDSIFGRWGIRYHSLIAPFNNFQVMQLIRRRYPDLADIQISCSWIGNNSDQYCNRCNKCLRTAMMLLALGEDPASLGLDLEKMFGDYIYYDYELNVGKGASIGWAASMIDMPAARKLFPPRGIFDRLTMRERRSFRIFSSIVKRLSENADPKVVMTHEAGLRLLPPELRDRLRSLSLEYWPETDPDNGTDDEMTIFETTFNWITEPLGNVTEERITKQTK
ncbi:MAG: hypothetical protein IPL01_19940 [Acidobacteria bacterium]|nr:hypothetical protein [Acidobacteriota bacterium]